MPESLQSLLAEQDLPLPAEWDASRALPGEAAWRLDEVACALIAPDGTKLALNPLQAQLLRRLFRKPGLVVPHDILQTMLFGQVGEAAAAGLAALLDGLAARLEGIANGRFLLSRSADGCALHPTV